MIDLDTIIDNALDDNDFTDDFAVRETVNEAVMETVRRIIAASRGLAAEADGNGNHVAAATFRNVALRLEHEL